MDSTVSLLVQQLGNRAPTLLVFAIGFVVALTHLSRAQRPATFALVACILLVVEGVVSSALWAWVVAAPDREMNSIGWKLSVLGWGGSIVRAGGLGLLVAARTRPAVGGATRTPTTSRGGRGRRGIQATRG